MHESKPKADLVKTARAMLPGFVVLRHEDQFIHGIPDISTNGMRKTAWWEVKLADPDFDSTGIQELTMIRLANVGFSANYIIYEIDGKNRSVVIVEPKNLKDWKQSTIRANGWNHKWVAEFMLRVHAGQV